MACEKHTALAPNNLSSFMDSFYLQHPQRKSSLNCICTAYVSRKIKDMEFKLSLTKRQLWMANKKEFSHLKSRITEVRRLTSKYNNHQYNDEFMREWMVIFLYCTFILKGKIDPNLFSSEICGLIEDSKYKLMQQRQAVFEGGLLIA